MRRVCVLSHCLQCTRELLKLHFYFLNVWIVFENACEQFANKKNWMMVCACEWFQTKKLNNCCTKPCYGLRVLQPLCNDSQITFACFLNDVWYGLDNGLNKFKAVAKHDFENELRNRILWMPFVSSNTLIYVFGCFVRGHVYGFFQRPAFIKCVLHGRVLLPIASIEQCFAREAMHVRRAWRNAQQCFPPIGLVVPILNVAAIFAKV